MSGGTGGYNYSENIFFDPAPLGYKYIVIGNGLGLLKIDDKPLIPPIPPSPNTTSSPVTTVTIQEIINTPVSANYNITQITKIVTLQQLIDTDPLYDSGDSDTIYVNNGWQNFEVPSYVFASIFAASPVGVLGASIYPAIVKLYYWTGGIWAEYYDPNITDVVSIYFYNSAFYVTCNYSGLPKIVKFDPLTGALTVYSAPTDIASYSFITIIGATSSGFCIQYTNNLGYESTAFTSSFDNWTVPIYYAGGQYALFYFVYNNGLYIRTNGGAQFYIYSGGIWSTAGIALDLTYIKRLLFPSGYERILAVTSAGTLTYTLDGLTQSGTIATSFNPPSNANVAYGGAGKIIFFSNVKKYSTDYGTTWNTVTTPPTNGTRIFYDPIEDRFLCGSPTVATLFASSDGNIWSQI